MAWGIEGMLETVNEMAKSPMGQLMLGGSAVRCVYTSHAALLLSAYCLFCC
jgi:hypothetical protein